MFLSAILKRGTISFLGEPQGKYLVVKVESTQSSSYWTKLIDLELENVSIAEQICRIIYF